MVETRVAMRVVDSVALLDVLMVETRVYVGDYKSAVMRVGLMVMMRVERTGDCMAVCSVALREV